MRRFLLLAVLVLIAGVAALWWFNRPLPILTVVTWPGTYERAQAAAMLHPFGAERRIDVRPAEYDGSLDELKHAVATRTYSGDVIDLELPNAITACRQGLLEKIDAATLPADSYGAPAAQDFVPGAIGPCWVGSAVYSHVIVFAPGRFAAPPASVADFFDLAKYPGRRALHRGAKYNLELALLADGVAPANVYATLATDAGLARALAKLNTIAGVILWTDRGLETVQSGQAVFAMALNGDVFEAARHGTTPGIIWDRQLYEMDVFAVPSGDPKRDMAMDFIRYATGSVPLAGMAGWYPAGPARRSALALVGPNPDLKIPMAPTSPTAHFETAFAVDDAWWADHGAAIAPRWQAFEAGLH